MRLRSKGLKEVVEGKDNMRTWKVEDVINWLKKLELEAIIPVFEREKIDGPTLIELTEENLKDDLQLKLGERKKIVRERDVLLQAKIVKYYIFLAFEI